jgi:RNA polymerase sigma-70 factor (ECF subfamily)
MMETVSYKFGPFYETRGDDAAALALEWTKGFITRPADRFCYRQNRIEARVQDLIVAAELPELVARCAQGDRQAFRLLYEQQSARLYATALRITRQSALAADAVHDAFLQVWQNAGRFDPARGNVEAWLLSLVRYRALDIARRRIREEPTAEPPDQADDDPDPLGRLESARDASALARCMAELPADRRHLVALAFVEGLSHSELAERLTLPLGTVKSWIRRALASLKRCLER